MTSRPRLVATDLDGTLLGADGRVSDRTRAVLVALEEEHDVPVVFVTGRPVRWMDELWTDVGGHGLAICSNGGIIFDVANREVRDAFPLTPPVLLDVAARVRSAVPGSMFALETLTGFAHEPDWLPRPGGGRPHRGPEPVVAPLDALVADDAPACVKLLARHDEADPEDYWRTLDTVVGDLATVTWSSTGALVEISARGVTKATTLATLCAELGVDAADVVAFGDMPNDVPMLSWVGRSWAMADAHPDVVAAADAVAGRHDEDGVAATLAALFGLAGWAGAADQSPGGPR
ncbi:HAD-IIB family hydrolase [Nocardioides zeae]|uniref:HAD family phosphatase n=1 Tax=Nocardioides zeae TaxID=1457234 RepID=A0A6P0HNM1_9ACTN|nr:HAD family phosphatase [Nocardioides zeae]